jgi:RNA polymerase sigma-70 factor (ECF subfamily)
MGTGEIDKWLASAREGEETGFLGLWRELQPRLLRYLRVMNCTDADDVASETWLQVVRDLSTFHGDGDDFRKWLFTVGRHRAIDAGRARSRRPTVSLPEDFDALADDQTVEDKVIEALSADRAVQLLTSLSSDQAQAVALRVIAGLDTLATASVLGRSRAAIRLALHRGLRSLAQSPAIHALSSVGDSAAQPDLIARPAPRADAPPADPRR